MVWGSSGVRPQGREVRRPSALRFQNQASLGLRPVSIASGHNRLDTLRNLLETCSSHLSAEYGDYSCVTGGGEIYMTRI